jgi:hypothetical protein
VSGGSNPSNPFVDTWTGEGFTLTISTSTWEMEEIAKGTYTYNNNVAAILATHGWTGTNWESIPAGEQFTATATISGGNTLSITGTPMGTITLTRGANHNGTQKTLVITNISDIVPTNAMVGIFPSGTSPEEAMAQTDIVARGMGEISGAPSYTVTAELYTPYNIRWTGSGTYDVYLMLEGTISTEPYIRYYRKQVSFTDASPSLPAVISSFTLLETLPGGDQGGGGDPGTGGDSKPTTPIGETDPGTEGPFIF